jgi:dihydroorotate dehydrogenase
MTEITARQGLDLRSPWLNAAGSLGFTPPESWTWSEPPGAFVTNPVSLFPRTPAEGRGIIPFPGGFLLHSGLPNPGLKGLLAIGPQAEPEEALRLARAGVGELPLVVNFPLTAAAEAWVDKLAGLGASAVSLGAPRGLLPGAKGKLVAGRLYGPAILPLALAAVRSLRRQALPVIAGGGVYRKADGEALLAAGATAVQLDSVLWL